MGILFLGKLFKAYDRDGDGMISQSEVITILCKANPSMTERELSEKVQAAFREIDANDDGEISLNEWISWASDDKNTTSASKNLLWFCSRRFMDRYWRSACDVRWSILPAMFSDYTTCNAETMASTLRPPRRRHPTSETSPPRNTSHEPRPHPPRHGARRRGEASSAH